MPELSDVVDDVQPEPEEIDLDPSLGDLMDDHQGEYDPEDHDTNAKMLAAIAIFK